MLRETKLVNVLNLRKGDHIILEWKRDGTPRKTKEITSVEIGQFCHNVHVNGHECYDRIATVWIVNVGRIVQQIAQPKTNRIEEVEIVEFDELYA